MLKDAGMSAQMGRPPKAGVKREKTTIQLLPDYVPHYRQLAAELGLNYTDTLAYLVALGAGQEIPAYIQKELRAADHARLSEPLIA